MRNKKPIHDLKQVLLPEDSQETSNATKSELTSIVVAPRPTVFTDLPDELKSSIFKSLPVSQVLSLMTVNKQLRSLIQAEFKTEVATNQIVKAILTQSSANLFLSYTVEQKQLLTTLVATLLSTAATTLVTQELSLSSEWDRLGFSADLTFAQQEPQTLDRVDIRLNNYLQILRNFYVLLLLAESKLKVGQGNRADALRVQMALSIYELNQRIIEHRRVSPLMILLTVMFMVFFILPIAIDPSNKAAFASSFASLGAFITCVFLVARRYVAIPFHPEHQSQNVRDIFDPHMPPVRASIQSSFPLARLPDSHSYQSAAWLADRYPLAHCHAQARESIVRLFDHPAVRDAANALQNNLAAVDNTTQQSLSSIS